ncbi:hypothetical protein ACEZ3G_02315 [Maribacter algicola]|uniref:Uncharacterized protein n=1 Tax=Meishania litoralis TaxID=3434685 RepID=A0ACC7LGK0_9FLAO
MKEIRDLGIEVKFKFMLSGLNNAYLRNQLESIKFTGQNVYFDSQDEFRQKYTFLGRDYKNCALLLNGNQILRIGNPTNSKNDAMAFLQLIRNN